MARASLQCKLCPGSPHWDAPWMLTNRPGCLGILMEDLPWMDVQPITNLIIQASLPMMTRGPAWCPCCLLHPGSPTPGHTLVKKHTSGCRFGIWHLAFIFLSLSARAIFSVVVHSVQRGPSKQGSFMPAKDPLQFKGRI